MTARPTTGRPTTGRRARLRTALATAALATTLFTAAPAAHADTAVPPTLTNGFGLTQVGSPVVHSATDFSITVTTPQLSGTHEIRIFLPKDYAAEPGKRWPVVYFLHGGAGTADDAAAAPALHSDSAITVAPDGGLKGWYADWVMQNTVLGAANWQTFHLDQVVPFIDANLRTLTDRAHRAVVGLSMGGYGALHYAEARPDLFGHTASLSGGIDLDQVAIRGTVVATELNLPNAICAASTSGLNAGGCATYGPVVDSDAVFGSPYPVFGADHVWTELNPASPANLAKLANTGIDLYTGTTAPIDAFTAIASHTVKDRLDQLGIPSRLDDYGNGSTLSPTCDGGHDYGCWAPAFADYMPRLQAEFDAAN
ncbi:alpha/beta hydrolase [Kitasatospora viridis]|uniref:Acyl-CoA:diacylglycerol acyltransferase n=1 Tax=Kitasatospora viridis TaxID=281105 RepID=A0A561S9F3_9ACTN|nr:alpha/beta hydrolase-fold protein [Kitasatospora viridis]TWF71491.1 S-formylglutathione hydrolase FrmB [Kitasatospora viridis]